MAQWEAVSPRVAPELDDLGLTRGLSQGSPKSVISRNFCLSRISGRLPNVQVMRAAALLY